MAKSGTVALIGRPNAGKSTLMNRALGEKVSIVSDKPQTTRHRMVGILTDAAGQVVFYDTPGVHKPLHRMNRQMLHHALEALNEADVVVAMVDASQPFGGGDAHLLDLVRRARGPKVLLLNKVDLVKKPRLLPLMERYGEGGTFEEIVPVSAATGDGVDLALDLVRRLLPEGPPLYDPELLTVHPERFLAAERIREKVLAETRDELPYSTAVLIERWEEDPEAALVRIYAAVLVERPGQKAIVIGHGASKIKAIGTAARQDLEQFLGTKVFLDLRVRCEPGWREDRRVLAALDRDVEVGLGMGADLEGG